MALRLKKLREQIIVITGATTGIGLATARLAASRGAKLVLAARDENRAPTLAELAQLDDAAFRARFSKSPIKRTGRDRFLRNVLIAIGNSRDGSLIPDADRLSSDPSPLVRGAAIWALSQLLPRDEFAARANNSITNEDDESVAEEWKAA